MSFVGAFAIFVCIILAPLAFKRLTIQNLMIILLLLGVHVLISIFYYEYSRQAAADAWGYYYDPQDMWNHQFSVGTIATFQAVHYLKASFGASYIDCFMVFQAVGFGGLVFLSRSFEDIADKLQVPERRAYLSLLFLPSVNFWSAAIGKDAPLFFAISLAVWSILRLRHRFVYFCIALGVMVLFRAHIALLATSGLAAAAFFERSTSVGRKFGLMAVAIAGMAAVLGPAERTINFDQMGTSSIAGYVNQQQTLYASAAGNTGVVHASLPVRIISLLFRPLFFDAHGFLGLIASVENIGVVLAFMYALVHRRDLFRLARRVFFVRFVLIYAAALLFSVSLVYYNVGLGLRERVMAYPMVFCLLVALWGYRRKIMVPSDARIGPAVVARPNPQQPVPEL